MNRLTKIKNQAGTTLGQYTYDSLGRRTDLDYANGTGIDYTYDAASRLTTIDSTTVTGHHKYTYTYDDVVAFYTYDSENRLAGATNADGTTSGPFNAALENMDLTFTIGGDANWAPVRPESRDANYGGPDSAKSGTITANQASWLQTTVTGKGTVKYYLKKAAGTDDAFRFKVDGSSKWWIYNSSMDWTQKTYTITTTGSHTLQWHYSKGGSGTPSDGGVWADYVEWIPDTGTPPAPTLAEALDCSYTITTGGSANWSSDTTTWYYGSDAAQSGDISDSQETWMQTTVTASAGDKASFYWKVSSDSGDYLKFYIDGQYQTGISGEVDWQKKSYSLSAGSHTLKWVYSKDSSGSAGSDCGWVDGLMVGTTSLVGQPDTMSEALDSQLKFTESGGQGWWIASGTDDEYYYEADAAQSDYNLPNSGETSLQAIVDSASSQTVKFYWKVSSEQSHDYLQFYIDSTLKDLISGEVGWQQKSYAVTSGIHILKWRYVKDGSGQSGDDCGWVDFVQWTGPSPDQDPANWQEIAYKHDVAGRRVEKAVDGYSTRYVYDGGHVIAEYDGNNNLLRKYIYGPGIDQPVSMIEVADASAAYYYHFDALGSVVALSNASGDTVQTYEYSVYGEVAVEDANHTNPYMFAGVRYDIEIGLYYNRARYYNPYTGRFLQTDPIGYGDGMNMYRYCRNNPLNLIDPAGTLPITIPVGPDLPTYVDMAIWIYQHLGISLPPPFPGPWNELHWFWHYFLGGGQSVDLGDVGLLDTFRAGVNEAEIKFQEDVRKWAKNRLDYLRECNEKRRANGIEEAESIGIHLEGTYDYDFAGAENIGSLYVLGHGTLQMKAIGYVDADGTYKITLIFSVADYFRDPIDVLNKIPDWLLKLEVVGGCPFAITAGWKYIIGGDLDE